MYFWVYGFRKGQSSTPFCGEREREAGRWKRDTVGVDGNDSSAGGAKLVVREIALQPRFKIY